MVKQFLSLLVLAGVVGGGWYATQIYDIRVTPRGEKPAAASKATAATPRTGKSSRTTIRVAALNLAPLSEAKLSNSRLREALSQIINHFDLVAVQGLQGNNQSLVVRLVELANTEKRRYDFVLCSAALHENTQQYGAFIYDRSAVEVDRLKVSVLSHPTGRFLRKPLVGLFRTLGPDAEEAFTFCLISVAVDPDRAEEELALLPDVYRGVRDNPWNEDDVILLGTLHADESQLEQLREQLHALAAIPAAPTTPRGSRADDNLLFDRRATAEFTGRSGVLDVLRECNLSVAEAEELSEHLPVWAEFSVYEGGQAGNIAGTAVRETR